MSIKNIFENEKIVYEYLNSEEGQENIDTLTEWINEVKKDKENFVKWAIGTIKENEALLNAKKDYAKEILQSSKVLENKNDRLKNICDVFMKALEIDKIETEAGKISYRKSSSVEIIDENLIPNEFIKIIEEKKIDKLAIKEALKDKEVTGCKLNIKYNIQIKG